jgi:phosphoribosyl 1,2-cyclic phosphate phosphodiesterase
MKLKYLGTAAAEGFPAVFCNCEYCKNARKTKGKNIRTRSQAIINDDLLLDLPADTYHHFLSNGIEGDLIKYLFVTHGHMDHFYPKELAMHDSWYAHDLRADSLNVYGGRLVGELFNACTDISKNVFFNPIKPFEAVEAGKYKVTALPAKHMFDTEALFYIIEEEGKTLLYAHDTGYFYDEVFDFIKEKGFKFDLISYDCTQVDIQTSDNGTHMGIDNILRVRERLNGIGALKNGTKHVINHFSHNGNPDHAVLEARVKDLDFLVSYDGMEVEL